MSDEITAIPVVFEYTLRLADTCNFLQPPSLTFICQYGGYLGRQICFDSSERQGSRAANLSHAFIQIIEQGGVLR